MARFGEGKESFDGLIGPFVFEILVRPGGL